MSVFSSWRTRAETRVGRISADSLGSFARFLTSGAFNTLATYLLYLALLPWFSYRVSYTAAYASGIGLAYVMNRYLVFRRPGGRTGPFLVALIYGGQYLLSLFLVTAWVRWLSAPVALAPLFAVAVSLPLTYLLNRLVFSGHSAEAQEIGPAALESVKPVLGRVALAILIGLPVLSLILNALAWVQFGFDLPFFDDWRGYDTGEIDSLELAHLFQPLNDTLTPIGFALDALAQRLLDGNSVVYQLMSMVTVLGALLLLQWRLLLAALGERKRAAICFVFTLLMLQPGSYWGRENIAYQQALPLVFTLLALWLALRRPFRDHWNLPFIFFSGLLSGFSYISGAFGALAAGAGMVVVVLVSPRQPGRAGLLRSGTALALAGAAASAVQVVFAILPSKGGTHIAGKPLALPTEPDFWFFYLGKLGRSLLLPANWPALSLLIVLLSCGLFLLIAVLVLRAAMTAEGDEGRHLRFAAMFGAISAMVLTYLVLVSAGRANYRPPDIEKAADVFSYAFERFHFFWATLLWPWLVAGGMVAYARSGNLSLSTKAARRLTGVLLAATVLLMIRLGAVDHYQRHSDEAAFRRPTIECLMTQLQKGEGIRCEEFNLPDLTPAYLYAREIGASFLRYFPVLPLELGTNTPSPWFRLSRDAERTEWRDIAHLSGSTYSSGEDPQLHMNAGHADGMASCVMVDVTASLRVPKPDTAKLYFRPLGQREFTEAASRSVAVTAGTKASLVSFRLENPIGFENTLRFDPVAAHQEFELAELEVRCRLRSRYDTLVPFYAITDGTSPGRLERLVAVGDVGGHFRAGEDPRVLFRTGHRQSMASCRFLEVQPIYKVQAKDTGQLFFRPRGTTEFSEQNSLTLPIAPQPEPASFSFVVESMSGFEDELRFDPVTRPQELLFADIKVRCLRRIDQIKLRR